MEHFVDKIIETDKKARQIIELAQREREHIKQKSIDDAKRDLALRKAAQEKQMKLQDVELVKIEQEELGGVDIEYILSKRNMDKLFNNSVDVWQKEILTQTLKVT